MWQARLLEHKSIHLIHIIGFKPHCCPAQPSRKYEFNGKKLLILSIINFYHPKKATKPYPDGPQKIALQWIHKFLGFLFLSIKISAL